MSSGPDCSVKLFDSVCVVLDIGMWPEYLKQDEESR